MDDALELRFGRLRAALAWFLLKTAMLRLRVALERCYRPDQPRVPAGSRDGGQWTVGVGGSTDVADDDDDAVRLAEDDGEDRYRVDLRQEEGTAGGIGHAIRRHVGRSDADLLAELDRDWVRYETATVVVTDYQVNIGTF